MAISMAAVSRACNVREGSRTKVPADWRLDIDAVRQACEFLEIAHVRVIVNQITSLRGRKIIYGRAAAPVDGEHAISVARWLTPEQASRTLWHELVHVAQYERTGKSPGSGRVLRDRGFDAYYAHPAEVEARASECNHDWLSLAH